ncbi:hypothetical protein [Desulfosporosinus sp. FKA]|uniref:hypothetical protein n=1 Tax=Desulfosporosinus sp. FKA TaxID=1969834 RepID=UPI001FA8AAB6|nr:hypothetical protein [Desulfosporosinus sp. FKA]
MLSKIHKDLKEDSEGADLLTSILTRYPELGAVHYWCEEHALKFTFMLRQSLELETVQNVLRPALELYHHLERQSIRVFQISCHSEEDVSVLKVVRDLESISQEEVGLLVELLKGAFAKQLVYDETSLPEEELEIHEEVINQILSSIKHMDISKNVIALRDEGRVLVFNN